MERDMNICIVEDSTLTVLLLKKTLAIFNKDIKLVSFTDAMNALKWFEKDYLKQKPEFLLIDINMPLMNGWEFIDNLHRTHPNFKIPIYMLSASCDPADREKAAAYPLVKGFIAKPIRIETINALLLAETTISRN